MSNFRQDLYIMALRNRIEDIKESDKIDAELKKHLVKSLEGSITFWQTKAEVERQYGV
jgi:hypothetical protein